MSLEKKLTLVVSLLLSISYTWKANSDLKKKSTNFITISLVKTGKVSHESEYC